MSDRILAIAVMDSIHHTTGYTPQKRTYWPLFVWLAVGVCVVAGVILGA